MGGTSADVGIIRGGQQKHTTEYEIEWGVPAAIPLIDIKSIGAGGGSIAWIDAGGFLRVGPQSAGAVARPRLLRPGRHADRPSPTPTSSSAASTPTTSSAAGCGSTREGRAARWRTLAAQAEDDDPIDLASSIVEIANENMASAIKMVSLERGHDPRRFALFAFGGAGPLHAAAVARALRIPRVLVPLYPGNASALGMLLADLRVDKIWTQAFKSTAVDAGLVERQFARIREAAVAELRGEGFAGEPEIAYSINMRYLGQNYEHEVADPGRRDRLPAACRRPTTPSSASTRSATATRSRTRSSSWSPSASPPPAAAPSPRLALDRRAAASPPRQPRPHPSTSAATAWSRPPSTAATRSRPARASPARASSRSRARRRWSSRAWGSRCWPTGSC